jgi:AcrR family transcriptional regulator
MKALMADPRVTRTRIHVLNVLREMLDHPGESITFSSLALSARVSRRTLYTHWGTVESAVAEAAFGAPPNLGHTHFMDVSSDVLRKLPVVLRELQTFRDR